MELRGKVAWISGGARMGEAVAIALSGKGCRVVLSYRRSRKPAEEAVKRLRVRGGDAMALRCDVERTSDLQSAVRAIGRRFGRLDVLVHLASLYEAAPVEKSVRAWDEHMAANARSAYALSLAAAFLMRRHRSGRMVHISDWTSASARPRYKGYAAYYVSKAAVKSAVEALALELAPTILVNAIAPGPVLPPPGLSSQEYRAVCKATPLGRWGGASEIAKAVLFLVETDFVTGETIRVDGGRHLY